MTFIKISFMATVLLFVVGCTATPEDAVRNVYDALEEGDMVKLVHNSTDEISAALLYYSLLYCYCPLNKDTKALKILLV